MYEVAAGESAGKVNATLIAPLLKARDVPTSVPIPIVGAFGSKKSFAWAECLPTLLIAMLFSFSYINLLSL